MELRWVKLFVETVYEKLGQRHAVIVESDEMWHYLCSKNTNTDSGRLIVEIPINSSTGRMGIVT
jgi:hypothetical protein